MAEYILPMHKLGSPAAGKLAMTADAYNPLTRSLLPLGPDLLVILDYTARVRLPEIHGNLSQPKRTEYGYEET